jgi:hypothetical protein
MNRPVSPANQVIARLLAAGHEVLGLAAAICLLLRLAVIDCYGSRRAALLDKRGWQ